MILHAYVDVYVLCVCINGHGYEYTTYLCAELVHNLFTKLCLVWHTDFKLLTVPIVS